MKLKFQLMESYSDHGQLLLESKQIGLISHNIRYELSKSLEVACNILQSNCLNGNLAWSDSDEENNPYVCFSKNLHLTDDESRYNVAFILDGDKMSDVVKFKEFNESTSSFKRFNELFVIGIIPSNVQTRDLNSVLIESKKLSPNYEEIKTVNDIISDIEYKGTYSIYINQLGKMTISNKCGRFLINQCKNILKNINVEYYNCFPDVTNIANANTNTYIDPNNKKFYLINNNIFYKIVNSSFLTNTASDGIKLIDIFKEGAIKKVTSNKKEEKTSDEKEEKTSSGPDWNWSMFSDDIRKNVYYEINDAINKKVGEIRAIGGGHAYNSEPTAISYKIENIRDYIKFIYISKSRENDIKNSLKDISKQLDQQIKSVSGQQIYDTKDYLKPALPGSAGKNFILLLELCKKFNIDLRFGYTPVKINIDNDISNLEEMIEQCIFEGYTSNKTIQKKANQLEQLRHQIQAKANQLFINNINIDTANVENIYFTSDLHLYDDTDRLLQRLELSDTELSIPKQYYAKIDFLTKTIIDNLIKDKKSNSVLFILGDILPHQSDRLSQTIHIKEEGEKEEGKITFKEIKLEEYIKQFFDQLSKEFSKIYLIRGNHDTDKVIDLSSKYNNIEFLGKRAGFSAEIDNKSYNFILTHEPLTIDDCNYIKEECKDNTININLCGHLHSGKKIVTDLSYSRMHSIDLRRNDTLPEAYVMQYNVSPEAHNLKPVSLNDIQKDALDELNRLNTLYKSYHPDSD